MPVRPVYVFALLALFAVGGCKASPVDARSPGSEAGPDLVVGERVDGSPVSIAQYRGKVVVVAYWASWCPPCWVEMPQLQAIHSDYRRRGVVVLAVNQGENTESIDKFIARQSKPFNLPILRDPEQKRSAAVGVRGVPTTVVFDREGREVKRYTGMFGFDSDEVRALIDKLRNAR